MNFVKLYLSLLILYKKIKTLSQDEKQLIFVCLCWVNLFFGHAANSPGFRDHPRGRQNYRKQSKLLPVSNM